MARDEMRIELFAPAAAVVNGSILIGDEIAAHVQFRVSDAGRRVVRRLRKMGLEINAPADTKNILKKS